MAKLLMFAAVREAAGTREAEIEGSSVDEVLRSASARFGTEFDRILPYCMVLLNDSNEFAADDLVAPNATVALLPPVSGGAL